MEHPVPRHPEVVVEVHDVEDDFLALCRVSRALRGAGHGREVDAFLDEALGAARPLLATCGRWVRLVSPAGARG